MTHDNSQSTPAKAGAEAKARQLAQETHSRARAKGQQVHQQVQTAARDKTEQARQMAHSKTAEARDIALQKAAEQQSEIAQRVSHVAEAFRSVGNALEGEDPPVARYAQRAGDKVDEAARYLSERSPQALLTQAQAGARRHPAACVGGAFAFGLLAGRFLKAGSKHTEPRQLPAARTTASEGQEEVRHVYG